MALLAGPADANAATTLGQTSASGGDCTANANPYTEVQESSAGSPSPSYTVPAGGGVITSWSHQGGPSESGQFKLKVYRPTMVPDQFTVVGSSVATLSANTLTVTSAQIAVQAGDVLGYTRLVGSISRCIFGSSDSSDVVRDAPSSDTADGMATSFNPLHFSNIRINVAAVLEADLDGDGLGDETQDNDDDNDTVLDVSDNCPVNANMNQANFDNDSRGDVCDPDDDNDTVDDTEDTCPFQAGVSSNGGCPAPPAPVGTTPGPSPTAVTPTTKKCKKKSRSAVTAKRCKRKK